MEWKGGKKSGVWWKRKCSREKTAERSPTLKNNLCNSFSFLFKERERTSFGGTSHQLSKSNTWGGSSHETPSPQFLIIRPYTNIIN